MTIDSHCHLQLDGLHQELPTLLTRMEEADVTAAVCVSISQEDIELLRSMLVAHPQLYASVGVHPCADASEAVDKQLIADTFASHPRFVAIGECGLDRFHDDTESTRKLQEQRFHEQLELARELAKPVIVHTRNHANQQQPDCIDATLAILEPYCANGLRAVLHCFTGTQAQAFHALDLGCWLSFTGIVSFSSATDLLAIASKVPLKRLMVETDSPYLAPEPHRGQRNEPTYVSYVAQTIANARKLPAAEFNAAVTATTRNFFNLN